jgi:flagellar motor switch protein FliN/FliY
MADENTPEEQENVDNPEVAGAPEGSEDLSESLAGVAAAAADVSSAAESAAGKKPATASSDNLDIIMDVTLQVTVEVGRARMTIQDLLQLGQGSVMELEKLAGEPLDVYVNGKCVARGEAVIVNEKFGVKLSEIISLEDRIAGLGR